MTSLVNINDACGDLLANPVFTDHLTRLQKNATGTSFPNSVVNWDFPPANVHLTGFFTY